MRLSRVDSNLKLSEKQGDTSRPHQDNSRHGSRGSRRSTGSSDDDSLAFWILIAVLIGIGILVCMRERSSSGGASGGSGAHGGRPPPYNPDAHHAPPPPYSASHAYQANNGFFGGANGFWTGAAIGGTLASLFGGRQGGGWGWGNGWGGAGGHGGWGHQGWGWGGRPAYHTSTQYQESYPRQRWSSQSNERQRQEAEERRSSTSTGTVRRSTGFGGTSTR
uniref:Store-operated calcium entry-associated regulatory factor n=1 Tax=Guillardia theta TaxID=55529 RepID=A0A7S4KF17_GUITH|mmetsp:Transcript_23354/g.75913  ORF Transcript_23354/g.75913 Transcript_23354/m.75913 type:complete len:220 (+) Transcript_23354:209-868(+)